MKKFAKLFSLLMVVAVFVLLPDFSALTASADGTTYVVGYNTDSGQWRWQNVGLTYFSMSQPDSDLYYLKDHLKDGDTVIVDGTGSAGSSLVLDLPVNMGIVTVMNCSTPVAVSASSIATFNAQLGSHVGVSGKIQNAYVYNDCFVTFNSHVENLEIIAPANVYNVIFSKSTVAHAKAHYDGTVYYEIYSVAENRFESETAVLRTDPMFYSTTPTAAAAANTASNAAASGEYDDVPKTGEYNPALLLVGMSLLCLAGSRKLKNA